jgi:ubiquinone/menaquinone biosynthesis C-methylase UbiE
MSSPHDHNRNAWDTMARNGQRLTLPATERHFAEPLKAVDGINWLNGDVSGLKMLCLAAGGGKHSVLYATAGADVTVVDISPAMLERDRQVAQERNLDIRAIEASMDDLSMLEDEQFDVVVQPVSSCYVPDISAVYREVARVTRSNGRYISQHKQPASLQAGLDTAKPAYVLAEPYYREGPLPPAPAQSRIREHGTHEYLHRWEQLLGELCRAGFVIEDLVEPDHADRGSAPGSLGHRGYYIAPYVCIKARRSGRITRPATPDIWCPDA